MSKLSRPPYELEPPAVLDSHGMVVIRYFEPQGREPDVFIEHAVTCVNACAEAGITNPAALPAMIEATNLLIKGLAEKRGPLGELHKRFMAAGLAALAAVTGEDGQDG